MALLISTTAPPFQMHTAGPSPAFLLDVADIMTTHGGGAHVTNEGEELIL